MGASTLNAAVTMTSCPAVAVPCGFDQYGRPVGLQVTGPLYGDLDVLQACRAYEEATAAAWPAPELEQRLAAIAAKPDAAVEAKRWKARG